MATWGRGLNLIDSRIRRDLIKQEDDGYSTLGRCRETNGLKEIKPQNRNCLKCFKEFSSEHAGVRMCVPCRQS